MTAQRSDDERSRRADSRQRMTAVQRAELLREAWRLVAERDYSAVERLLGPLPVEELIAEPELGCILGSTWNRQGKSDEVLKLLPLLREPCRRSSNALLVRVRGNDEGIALMNSGRLDEAQDRFQQVMASASEAGDVTYVSMACINLGVIAHIRGDYQESLAYQQRALAAFQSQGRQRQVGWAHHNSAMCYRDMGLLEEAGTHFEHAYRMYKSHGSEDEVSGVESERALLLCYMGDFRMAEALARRSLARDMALGSDRFKGEVLRVLGIVAFGRGDRQSARVRLEQARELAQSTSNVILEAEVMEEFADLERVEGQEEASRTSLERAVELYQKVGSPKRAERARERILAPRTAAWGGRRDARAG